MSTDENDEFDIITNEDVDETSDDVSTSEDEGLPQTNSVAKLLKRKNEAEKARDEALREKDELARDVWEIRKELDLQKFLKKFPKAEDKMEDIEALLESGEVKSLESAYYNLIWRDPQLLAQLWQSNPFSWNVPKSSTEEKTLDQMSREEVKQAALREAKKLKF